MNDDYSDPLAPARGVVNAMLLCGAFYLGVLLGVWIA
jgi:hypothetical protein